jgi:hypothetical protein
VTRDLDAQLSVDGTAFRLRDDYSVLLAGVTYPGLDNSQVVVGGNVGDSTTWITAEQARGKFVVLLQRPGAVGISTAAANHPRFREAVAVAHTNYGRIYPQLAGFLRPGQPTPKLTNPPPSQRPVTLFMSNEMAERLIGVPLAQANVGTLGKTVKGHVAYTEKPLVARNVVAVLPGTDANLRGQYVAISAHLDHDPIAPRAVDHDSLRLFNAIVRRMELENSGGNISPQQRATIKVNVDSLRALRPARRDSILNGADDDGSGTVAMIEIAEAMAGTNHKPKRSTLFVWHVAEELGLVGARYFTDHPTVPRDSIVADLNLDMIGRGGPGEEPNGGPTYLQLIGWRRLSNELGNIIEAVNRERTQPFQFDLSYDADNHPENYYCRSDHAMYARYGIPVAFFSTGSHGDYHQVTDEPQYIDYTKLRDVTQLVNDIALRVAGLDHRVVLDKPKPDPNAPCVRNGAY